MEKNNVKLIGVFASVLLLVIIITASFAYFGSFDVNLTNNVAVNVNSVSPGDVIFVSNATQLNLQVPAANMSQTVANNEVEAASNTATLTVNLTGAKDLLTTCTYDVVYEYNSDSNVYGTSPTTKNSDKEITLQVSNVNGTNNFASEKNFDSVSMASYYNSINKYYILVSGATIESTGILKSQNISITAKYYNLDIPQTSLEGSAFTGKIYVTNHKCETSELPGYYTILANNGGKEAIEAKGIPDFSKIADTNEGMYAAEDDLGTSYYFRGAVNNNWVKFGKDNSNSDMYWRIIRINGDGSIRMIYSGLTPPESDDAVTLTGTDSQLVTTSVFNSSSNGYFYAGYMYKSFEFHGNSNESTIKQTIDKWYAETSLAYNDLIAKQSLFCNDRNVTSGSTNYYEYNVYTRLNTTKKPILLCMTDDDKFTSKDSTIGNKALTYSVGLITADEISMAGGVYKTSNNSYYLYTNQGYWSMSPSYYSNNNGYVRVFFVNSEGKLEDNSSVASTTNSSGVRPVINLISNVKLSGDGTWNNVYTVS